MALREFVNDAQNRPWRLSHLHEPDRDYASLAEVIQDATRITEVESRLAAKQYTPLAEIADFYLPKNSRDRDRVIQVFTSLHQLFLPEEGKWFIGADTLVPFLAIGIESETTNPNISTSQDQNEYDPKSNSAHLAAKLYESPTFTWYTPDPHFMPENIKKNVFRVLTAPTENQKPFAEELDSSKFDLSPNQRLFRLLKNEGQITNQYIILEEHESLLHNDNISISYATGNGTEFKTRFTLKLEYDFSSYEPQGRWTNWDEDEGKRLQFLNGVPYIALSLDTQKTLAAPMHMGKNQDQQRYGIDWDESYLRFQALSKGCHEWNRDAYLASGDTESGTAHYYIEVAKKAAEIISLAVSGEKLLGKPVIDPKVAVEFREVFSRLSNTYNFSGVYSPIEMAITRILWNGKDQVWDLVHEFTYYMTRAFTKDPVSFFRYVRTLGLDSILPHFREMTEGEDLISFAASAFDLAPNLSRYYDHRPGYECEQSDEYFMKICLARAYHTIEVGSEPIASLITYKGKIIASACNEPTEYEDIYLHAEDLAIARAKAVLRRTNPKLSGCTIYITTEPCSECATKIRKHEFEAVKAGVATEMGGETKFGILSSDILTRQRSPYTPPPKIIIGILEDEMLKLYLEEVGWEEFITPSGIRGVSFRGEPIEPIGTAKFRGEVLDY